MYYISSIPNPSGAYPSPQSTNFDGAIPLTDEQVKTLIEHNGFVTIAQSGKEVTVTQNLEAWEKWKASQPEPKQEAEYTEIELAQQAITDLELNDIEQGQQMTDLELMILEGRNNV